MKPDNVWLTVHNRPRQSGQLKEWAETIKSELKKGNQCYVPTIDKARADRVRKNLEYFSIKCEVFECWDTGASREHMNIANYFLHGIDPPSVVPKLTALILKPLN